MKFILNIMWISNLIIVPMILIPFAFPENYDKIVDVLFISFFGQILFAILGTLSLILWVYCVATHNKRSNVGYHIALLIFLSTLYVPFYYYQFFIKKSQ